MLSAQFIYLQTLTVVYKQNGPSLNEEQHLTAVYELSLEVIQIPVEDIPRRKTNPVSLQSVAEQVPAPKSRQISSPVIIPVDGMYEQQTPAISNVESRPKHTNVIEPRPI